MIKVNRVQIAALAASASVLVALVTSEGYTDKAVIPTKGDRPTVGFGSTFNEDGSPIKIGDKVDPVSALKRSYAYIAKSEIDIKKCLSAPLYQAEYDIMIDFAYQYGTSAICKSSIVKLANEGEYKKSCEAYKKYKYAAGYDCSIPYNTRCSGVWKRSLWRSETCLSAQNPETAPSLDTGAVARSGRDTGG